MAFSVVGGGYEDLMMMSSTTSSRTTTPTVSWKLPPKSPMRRCVTTTTYDKNNNNKNYTGDDNNGGDRWRRSATRSWSVGGGTPKRLGNQQTLVRQSSPLLVAPRRVHPQYYDVSHVDLDLDGDADGGHSRYYTTDSSLVLDANLSFSLMSGGGGGGGSFGRGAASTRVRSTLSPVPAFREPCTASAYLSTKIADFLERTDHVAQEWRTALDASGGGRSAKRALRHHRHGSSSSMHNKYEYVKRSKSANNILVRGFQYYSANLSDDSYSNKRVAAAAAHATRWSRDSSLVYCGEDDDGVADNVDDRTDAEIDELSEMTVDLSEEHSTSALTAERLNAETSERVKMERELAELTDRNRELQRSSERLEMELLYAKSDLSCNGMAASDDDDEHFDDDDNDDGGGDNDSTSTTPNNRSVKSRTTPAYKGRYERTLRELEYTKRRMQQQHEDDLEQLVGLKKQLEKKLTDAYEEVEEQRQIVAQWKRKVQKLNGESADMRHSLEEQSARNQMLEKKQRRFDADAQQLHEELRAERVAKERACRERELLTAEKYTTESRLEDLRMDLEAKEEQATRLQRELDELAYGGKTEEEIGQLRRHKMDAERRLHDQEEELDEMAGHVQLLEQAKLKLEMQLEQVRKQSKKEAHAHDEELEEVRAQAQKKVRALEMQLEQEHEERTALSREKHELERRLVSAVEHDRSEKMCDEALLARLKRDLKKTKALLRDAQQQLERQRGDQASKALVRQLRNQVEDLECARTLAAKARQTSELELMETQSALEDSQKARADLEDRLQAQHRVGNELQVQLEENEEELADVLKKYKAAVQQTGLDQMALQEQVGLVADLEVERNALADQLAELSARLESAESLSGGASGNVLLKRSELKVKELESKLELEQTTRARMEVQIGRLKETVEKLHVEVGAARAKEQASQDQIRKLQRSIRELRDEHNGALTREGEALLKRKELEKRCEMLEAECQTARTDLRLALKRIEDLQSAIQGDLDDTDSIDNSDSYSSDDSVSTFLANHRRQSSTTTSMNAVTTTTAAASGSSGGGGFHITANGGGGVAKSGANRGGGGGGEASA